MTDRELELLLLDPPPVRRRRRSPRRRCFSCGAVQGQGLCADCQAKERTRPPGLWYCSACRAWTAGGPRACNRCRRGREGEAEAVARPATPSDPPVYQLGGFACDSSAVPPSHTHTLSELAAAIVGSWKSPAPVDGVTLIGHTAPPEFDPGLGRRRAAAVGRLLSAEVRRIDPVGAVGFDVRTASEGEVRPVANNGTAGGRAANRRVTVAVLSEDVKRTTPSKPKPGPTPKPKPTPAPKVVRVTLRVVNRLLTSDPVANAAVEVIGPGGARATGTTSPRGVLNLTTTGLPDGNYTLRVDGPVTSGAAVGPATARATPPPDRIWRPFTTTVRLRGGRPVSVSGATGGAGRVGGGALDVRVQPVWMASPNRGPARAAADVDLIVLHHTAGTTASSALNQFMSLDRCPDGSTTQRASAHYLVDTDGQVLKLVSELNPSNHAGRSHWGGRDGVNDFSVGIEIVHAGTGPYPPAQRTAALDLVRRIRAAFPSIPAVRVVGHSDIGTCPVPRDCSSRSPCPTTSPRRLGRKSGDPGVGFRWDEVEAAGFGLRPRRTVALASAHYGGFFAAFPRSSLDNGDSDARQVYGGVHQTSIPAGVVAELQGDLTAIGYFCPVTGTYGLDTAFAVQMFQEHFSRRLRGTRSTGRSNAATAALIKAVRP